MMLRSSSTPVLGSLLPSFSESPGSSHHHNSDPTAATKHPPTTTTHQNYKKLSFHRSGSLNYTPFSCNSSPISDLNGGTQRFNNGFPRAQSEGNLEALVLDSTSNPDEEFSISNPQKKSCSRRQSSLGTIPSFSFCSGRNRYEDEWNSDEEEEEEEEREELEEINGGSPENTYGGGEKSMGVRNRGVNLEKQRMGGMNEEIGLLVKEHSGAEMYLARGLGVESFNIGFGGGGGRYNGGGGGSGGGGNGGGGDGDSGTGIEEHFKRLVEENPGNPLFLRNYAQFLKESKGDLKRAEEYYSRAILADPKDGEVLSQYAKLVWELHHDQDTALSYFERAVHAAPQDSHVRAAYASFLWEAEEDEDEDDFCVLPSHFQHGAMASATA